MDATEYLDWRELVKAALTERAMSQRELAQAARVSEGQLSMWLTGRRSLEATEHVERLAAVVCDTPEARAWFGALVDLESPNARARIAAEVVVRTTLAHLSAPSPQIDVVELQSDWRANAILELASCAGFRADPAWIGRHLVPPVPPPDVAALWERLRAADLVRPCPAGGWEVRSVLMPPDLRRRAAVAVASLHEAVLGLAGASLHRRPTERRGGVVTMALSEAGVERLLLRFREIEQEVVALAAADPGPKTRVYLATVQLFPCSEATDSVDVEE